MTAPMSDQSTHYLTEAAPWPASRDQVTARAMAKHLIARSVAERARSIAWFRAGIEPGSAESDRYVQALEHSATLHALGAVLVSAEIYAPEAADEFAKVVWWKFEDGEGDEMAWAELTGCGIDAQRIHDEMIARFPAPATPPAGAG